MTHTGNLWTSHHTSTKQCCEPGFVKFGSDSAYEKRRIRSNKNYHKREQNMAWDLESIFLGKQSVDFFTLTSCGWIRIQGPKLSESTRSRVIPFFNGKKLDLTIFGSGFFFANGPPTILKCIFTQVKVFSFL